MRLRHVAISRPVNDNTFLVLSSHKELKSTDVIVDEELAIDTMGAAGVYYLKPSSQNTIKIDAEAVPHNVIIENDSLEFTPEYGRGYHTKIGKDAPVIIIGRLVNNKNEPEGLVYGKIFLDTCEKTFFTNLKGMFQTTLEETGKDYSIQLIDYPGMAYYFTVDKAATGVINLKSISVMPKLEVEETEEVREEVKQELKAFQRKRRAGEEKLKKEETKEDKKEEIKKEEESKKEFNKVDFSKSISKKQAAKNAKKAKRINKKKEQQLIKEQKQKRK